MSWEDDEIVAWDEVAVDEALEQAEMPDWDAATERLYEEHQELVAGLREDDA